MELLAQEFDDALPMGQPFFAGHTKQHEVINVPAIESDTKLSLDEVIQIVQINQRIRLTQEIPDRNPHGISVLRKQHHHVNESLILNPPLNLLAKNCPINPVKKLPNIELQGIGAIRHRSKRLLRIIRGGMSSFSLAAGKRLFNESGIEDRVNHAINRVLHDQIVEGWRVNLSELGLVHLKSVIRLRTIRPVMERLVHGFHAVTAAPPELVSGPLISFVPTGIQQSFIEVFTAKRLLKQVADAPQVDAS